MAALLTVRCFQWQIFGLCWLIFGPFSFLCLAVYKTRVVIVQNYTLVYSRSPHHTLKEMGAGWTAAPGIRAKLSQLFIYFMDFRFTGAWAKKVSVCAREKEKEKEKERENEREREKERLRVCVLIPYNTVYVQDDVAKFWGWLMAAYTDSFWMILLWILIKKIWTSLNKHLLEGQYNAVTNIFIYVLDFVLFVWKRPFRDNTVNLAQGLSAFSNMAAITVKS